MDQPAEIGADALRDAAIRARDTGALPEPLRQNAGDGLGILEQSPALIDQAGSLLKLFCNAKADHHCDFDDLFILMACWIINHRFATIAAPVVQPATINSIADYIGISRETVRRRLSLMEYKKVMKRYPTGYVAINCHRTINVLTFLLAK